MTLPIFADHNHALPHLRAARVLLFGTLGLLVHALFHPGRRAAISRTTGRVGPR